MPAADLYAARCLPCSASRWLLLSLAGMLFACTPLSRPVPPPILEIGATESSMTPAPPVIRLVTAGSEEGPRRRLRYRFHPGARSVVEVDVTSRGSDGQEAQTVRTLLALRTKDVDDTGDARLEFEIAAAQVVGGEEIAPDVRARLDRSARRMVRLWGTALLSSRGVVKEFGWSLPRKLPVAEHQILVDLSRAIKQLYPPLPDEEVGKGAAWEVTNEVVNASFRMKTRTEYKVLTLRAEGVELGIGVAQSAGKQPFGDARRPGARVALENTTGAGQGQASLVLDPPRARSFLRLSMQTRFAIDAQGSVSHLAMNTASEITSEQREAR